MTNFQPWEHEQCGIKDFRWVQVIEVIDRSRTAEQPPKYLFRYFFIDHEGRILGLDAETNKPLGYSSDETVKYFQYICLNCFSEFVFWRDVLLHLEENDPLKRDVWQRQ